MTNSAPPGSPAAARLVGHVQRAARTAIAHTILRTAPEASSAEAVRIARELELAVHAEVRAREAGESWAAVGALLGIGPVAAERPGTLAEMAFDYAAGARTLLAWYPDRHIAAEQLLEHAATMLDADVDPERADELVQRQIAVAALG